MSAAGVTHGRWFNCRDKTKSPEDQDDLLEIKPCGISYNHLHYIVEVRRDHTLYWQVSRSRKRGKLTAGVTLPADVNEDPELALRNAHEEARRWIDGYVEKHRILEDAAKTVHSEYAGKKG